MKKVLFVATVVKLHIMVFHIPFLKLCKKMGYEVHVAARNDYNNNEECIIPFCDKFFDLPFERLPLKKNNLYVHKELKKIITTNEYEIVHCHTPMGGVLGRLAAREARRNGTKVFYTAHGFHFFKGAPLINWLVYYSTERFLSRYTDVLITINKEDYERARKFKAEKVDYVPGVGVDINEFRGIYVDREKKRNEIDVKHDDFVILSVGELNKNKNHQVIIKAISSLKNLRIKYVICGQGILESELKKLANELGVEKQVKFLGYRKDIPEIYKIADLFAFPSFREGLSLALMEAMASGLPCVVSKIRGNIDLIEEGKNGYLVSSSNINTFAEKIKNLIDNDSLRQKISKNNTEDVKHYSLQEIEKRMKVIYGLD